MPASGRNPRRSIKICAWIGFLIFFIYWPLCTVFGEEDKPDGDLPVVSASSAILLDRDTGRILFEKNPRQRRPVASITKIMTAVVALEHGRLSSEIRVSEKAASAGGSSIWLEAGEIKTLEELLYGLMLRSGNDAAYAIAEHIGGTVENFAVMMTQKAREIGALQTRFKNPHGLHHEEHYSTAYDMALITQYALENETFKRIISSPRAIISWPGHEWDRVLHNQNKLLRLYEGGDGVKTGWTTPAGRCFVGSATRDSWQLITVVLNAPEMWEDARILLDYGFDTYNREKVIFRHQFVKTFEVKRAVAENGRVVAAEDFYYPLKAGEREQLRYLFDLNEPRRAPIKAGSEIGVLEIQFKGETVGRIKLIAGEDIRRAPFYQPLIKLWKMIFPRKTGEGSP